jgi:outer membrane protein OmpA-like peptidoglycan-associated protein
MSERVHSQVKAAPAPFFTPLQSVVLQRKYACGGAAGLTGEFAECGKKRLAVQRKSANHAELSNVPPIVHEVLRSPGQSLDTATRAFFEPRFGHDFSRVRVHTDARAAESARAVNALAYTVGRDVVFGAGQYSPNTNAGQQLMAHELTHVVQQRSSAVQAKAEISQPGDVYEQEADRVAGTIIVEPAIGLSPDIKHWAVLPMVMRTVSESGIKDGKFSYSTHCGWIDWGHSNPAMARRLINDVQAASAKLRSAETARSGHPGMQVVGRDQPGVGLPDVCPSQYETGEREASSKPQGPLIERLSFPNHQEVYLHGYEVDRSDASRFSAAIGGIANELISNPSTRVEIYGFSDCMGTERRNLNLRAERALAVKQMLPESIRNRIPVITFAALDRYLTDNTTREGRRRNRAVAIKLLLPLMPERVVARQESGVRVKGGFAGVNAAAIVADILRPLSPDEELSVSMGIFVRVSWAFEETQFSTDWIVDSSFSEEDLPSNLLGFYRAARGLSRADVEKACDAWDVSRSLVQFQGYTFVKNRSFSPPQLPAGGAWPTQFSKIREEPPGQIWEVKEVILRIPGHTFRTCLNAGANVPCQQ